jgi:hypothetical protein
MLYDNCLGAISKQYDDMDTVKAWKANGTYDTVLVVPDRWIIVRTSRPYTPSVPC